MHVAEEGPANIRDWANQKQHELTYSKLYAGDEFPVMSEFDLLLVMGGPMSYDDDQIYPFLSSEKRFIKKAIDSQKSVLGICLGAQLIAESIGGKGCHSSHQEIGWWPLRFDQKNLDQLGLLGFPDIQDVFHWHGDTFEIPKGAVGIASTNNFPNQGFILNQRVIGLQFHLEATPASVRKMVSEFAQDLNGRESVQTAEEILSNIGLCEQGNMLMAKILDHLESFSIKSNDTNQTK